MLGKSVPEMQVPSALSVIAPRLLKLCVYKKA